MLETCLSVGLTSHWWHQADTPLLSSLYLFIGLTLLLLLTYCYFRWYWLIFTLKQFTVFHSSLYSQAALKKEKKTNDYFKYIFTLMPLLWFRLLRIYPLPPPLHSSKPECICNFSNNLKDTITCTMFLFVFIKTDFFPRFTTVWCHRRSRWKLPLEWWFVIVAAESLSHFHGFF